MRLSLGHSNRLRSYATAGYSNGTAGGFKDRVLVLAALVATLSWVTDAAPSVTAPSQRSSLMRSVCRVEPSDDTNTDDSPAIKAAFERCSHNGIIVFSDGHNYNLFAPLEALSLENVQIQLLGNLSLPQDMAMVQRETRDARSIDQGIGLYSRLAWIRLQGHDVQWLGNEQRNLGWINSHGQQWWDANVYPNNGLPDRPSLLSWNISNSELVRFKSMKPIGWNVELGGDNIRVSHSIVDAVSTGGFPFNTDGFGTSGRNIRIENSYIFNGDDAIAVHDGAENVTFANNVIGWQTHGMSIGSLGKDRTKFTRVSNIRFENITVFGGLYAARFKSWKGGQGLAKHVSWSNIRFFNVSFPIFVNQLYRDQNINLSADGDDSAVEMQDFTWSNFYGTINDHNPGDATCLTDPCWYNVNYPSLTHREVAILSCYKSGSCSNFKLANIHIKPMFQSSPAMLICQNIDPGLSPELGFECRNGTWNNDSTNSYPKTTLLDSPSEREAGEDTI